MSYEEAINIIIKSHCDTNKVSDGYHTFGELYEHRIRLFITLCRLIARDILRPDKVWVYVENPSEEWFLLGINTETGKQITYHLPARFWSEVCEFAIVATTKPEYDGHTSQDVLERLSKL